MFICTLKASNIKFFAAVLSAVAILITLVGITGGRAGNAVEASAAPEAKISFEKVRSNDERRAFLAQFGWEVSPEEIKEVTLKLPAEFDSIMNEYNEIQKTQGLDLSKYKGEEVVRYTYAVTNYPGYDGDVLANIIVCKNRVIGGDVCSADPQGFIGSLYRPDTDGGETQTDAATATDEATQTAPSESEAADAAAIPLETDGNEPQSPPDDAEAADALPSDGEGQIGEAAYDGGTK